MSIGDLVVGALLVLLWTNDNPLQAMAVSWLVSCAGAWVWERVG